jgi:predicted Zn-dependent protease
MQKLIDALLGQRKLKEYQVGEAKVMMQTLTAGEQAEISRVTGNRGLDYMSQIETSKIPILARSMVSINNVPIDGQPEVREKLRNDPSMAVAQAVEQVLSDMDWSMVEYIFTYCYSDLVQERGKELDSLKNSSRGQSADSSGKSAQNSAQLQPA